MLFYLGKTRYIVDMFPCTHRSLFSTSTKTSDRDVLTVVSGHVETVVLLSKKNVEPKHTVSIGVDADEYYRIKNGK